MEFPPTRRVRGPDHPEAFDKLFEKFGKVTVAGIGVAGEFRYGNSGICFDDLARRATRYAGRGGLGAVMGSKGSNSSSSTARARQGRDRRQGAL